MAKPVPCEVVLQVPRNNRTKVSEEGNIWGVTKTDWRDTKRPLSPIWCGIGGRACDARSCPHVFEYPPETQRGVHGRKVEREVGGTNPSGFREKARECKGIQLLVDGILCQHSGIG